MAVTLESSDTGCGGASTALVVVGSGGSGRGREAEAEAVVPHSVFVAVTRTIPNHQVLINWGGGVTSAEPTAPFIKWAGVTSAEPPNPKKMGGGGG